MFIEEIDHTTLIRLAETAAERSARAIGQAGGWRLIVKFGVDEYQLTAHNSGALHVFRRLDNLANYLKQVGIAHFDVEAANFTADTSSDDDEVIAAANHDHDEAAYTAWLKAEIQEAIDDPSPAIAHDEAMRQIRAAIKRG